MNHEIDKSFTEGMGVQSGGVALTKEALQEMLEANSNGPHGKKVIDVKEIFYDADGKVVKYNLIEKNAFVLEEDHWVISEYYTIMLREDRTALPRKYYYVDPVDESGKKKL